MNAAQLHAHFDRISEAPDAIPHLRRFILDLAVRGKLVEQDTKDEPASELLKRIESEKARLVKAGEIRDGKPLPVVEPDEVPFRAPAGWEWVRIRQVTTDRGQTIPERDFTYIDVTAINKEVGRIAGTKIVSAGEAPSRARKVVAKGDTLYSCVRPYLLNVAIIESDIVPAPIASTAFAVLNGFGMVLAKYQWTVLRSPFMVECVEAKMRGQAYPAINDSDFAMLPFPLPPLAEQHHIVAKVEELNALCDRLEVAQAERESRRDRLAAVSLHRLNQPADAGDAVAFREHSRFVLDHLPRLTNRPDQIPALRQTILDLAVHGQLVPQDPNDEPAALLLAFSDRVRQATAKVDRRADAERQVLLAANDRWEVPSSWEWCALADVVLFIDYRGKTPKKVKHGVRLITAKNVRTGFINLSPEEFLSEESYQSWMKRGLPKDGDVLFTTEAPMGNAAVVRLHERFALAQRVICFRPYGGVRPDFLALQLLAEPFQSTLKKVATGLTAKGIKAAKLKRLPVAVPPDGEQQRIVAKVEQLLSLCDELEAQLSTAQAESHRFLESVLHHALVYAAA